MKGKPRHSVWLAGLAIFLVMTIVMGCASAAPAPSPTAPKSAPASSPVPKPAASTPAAKAPAAPSKPADVKKVNIAYAIPETSFLPFYIAIQNGYAKEEGLDATMTQIAGAVGVKTMVAGDIDASLSGGSVLAAALQGVPIKLVAVNIAKAMFWLYAQPNIKSIKDLKGKQIAIDAIGGSMDAPTRQILRQNGVDPNEVTFIGMAGAARYGAAKAGSVDAAVLSPSEVGTVKQTNLVELAFFGDKIPQIVSGVGMTDKMIKENPDTVKRVVRANIKALRFIKSDKAGTMRLMSKFMGMDEATANSVYDVVAPHYTDDGLIADQAMQTIIDAQREAAKIKEAVPIEKVLDLGMARKANEELKAEGWKP